MRLSALAFVSIVLAAALTAIALSLAFGLLLGVDAVSENGPIEDMQAVLFFAGAVAFVDARRVAGERDRRPLYLSLALLALSFTLRELDFRMVNLPPAVRSVIGGGMQNIWIGLLWLALVVSSLRNARTIWRAFLSWMREPSGWLIVASGLFLLSSYPFDKNMLPLDETVADFAEETVETAGAMLLFASALFARRMRAS